MVLFGHYGNTIVGWINKSVMLLPQYWEYLVLLVCQEASWDISGG